MQVSVVERQSWKRCRRQWYLTAENYGNLTLVGIVPALQLGGMVQECLSYWQEHPEVDPVKYFAQISQVSIQKYKDSYVEHVGAPASDEELDPMYELIKLGLAMVSNYKDHYKKPLPKDFKIIQTEQRIMVAIPNTKHWECNNCHWMLLKVNQEDFWNIIKQEGEWTTLTDSPNLPNVCPVCKERAVTWQPHYLRGTLDSLLQDTKGKVYPLERKTYGQRPEPTKLTHDDQMLAYLWILTQLFGMENVGGVLYDGLWKREKPPAKRGNARQLEMSDLFYRDIFPRPPEEIEEFGRLLKDEVDEMADSIMMKRFYINRTWQGCWDCSMNKLCSAMSRGEDTEYVKATFYKPREYGNIMPDEDD